MTIEEIVMFWEEHFRLPYPLSEKEILQFWNLAERPGTLKQEVVKEYGKEFSIRTFIETGTYHGDMVQAVISSFEKIVSIELGDHLYQSAVQKFQGNPNVTILHGDSGAVLGNLLKTIDAPCLFWLDGHYSYADTARGNLDTPITSELEHILTHAVRDHVILIDDARCFIGQNDVLHDYPTLEELRKFVQKRRKDVQFYVEEDIIRIHP